MSPGTCYLSCEPSNQGSCPCDRFCEGLEDADGGIVGGFCHPGNTEGERCGTTFGPGAGNCAQNLFCAVASGSTDGYCSPTCASQADCPTHTVCAEIQNSSKQVVGMACVFDTAASGAPAGSTCTAATSCISGTLCDGTCLTQCDGPSGTCATGTCTAVTEGTGTLGYVCK